MFATNILRISIYIFILATSFTNICNQLSLKTIIKIKLIIIMNGNEQKVNIGCYHQKTKNRQNRKRVHFLN